MSNMEHFFQSDMIESDTEEAYRAIIEESESGDIGYYTLPEDTQTLQEIKDFCANYDFSTIKNIVIIGIGGSSLGTKAIDHMLSHRENRNDKNLIFMENVDPNEIARNLKDVKFEESFFIMISKSGGTIETTSHVKYIVDKYGISFDSPAFVKHFAIITDPHSPLDQFAKDFTLTTFHLPLNVGGRFSVFTPVGLLPLTILGYDVEKMLEGARALKESFFAMKEDAMVRKAHYYASNQERLPINVLFTYSSSFKYFNDWYVQLWGESLGKINRDGERVGLTPIGIVGSVDQHSFLQLIIEGPQNKTVTMIKVEDFENDMKIPDVSIPHLEKTNFINNHTFNTLINAQCDATMQSIKDQDVDVDLITLPRLDEKTAGEMILYYELLTSITGHFLNVNTYDQPGVELGKVILKEKFEK
jgi:glucose-6-phosphate isomerase